MLLFAGTADAQESTPAKLVVGTRHVPPFAIKQEDGQWSGLSIELWESIAADLGWDYELKELPLNELFTGLESKQLDAVVAATTMTADREAQVDFSHSFLQSGLGIAIRKHDRRSVMSSFWRVVVQPLSVVMGLILGILVIVGVVIWLAERKKNAEHFSQRWIPGIGDGIWWAVVTMTTVGYGDKTPRTTLGKTIALAWMLVGVVIISLFTAFVASRLTAEHLQVGIKTIADLADATTGTVENSTSEDFLKQNGIARRTFENAESALQALSDSKIDAVLYDRPTLRFLVVEKYAKLTVLPTVVERENYAFAFPEGSQLLESVNQKLLERINSPDWKHIEYRYLGQ